MRIQSKTGLVFTGLLVAICAIGLLWLFLRREGIENVLQTSTDTIQAFPLDREQLLLELPDYPLLMDEPVAFKIKLRNIHSVELNMIERAKDGTQTDNTFFLQVSPWDLRSFSIAPNSLNGRSGPVHDRYYLAALAPDETGSMEWRGSFRTILAGIDIPSHQHRPGEYLIRALYHPPCWLDDAGKDRLLCNSVTSEWVRLQVRDDD